MENSYSFNTLTNNIEQLTHLTSLELADLDCTCIPIEIGQLVNLTTLRLGGSFTHLPAEIGQLVNLTRLGRCSPCVLVLL